MFFLLGYIIIGMLMAGYKIPTNYRKRIKEVLTDEEQELLKKGSEELPDEKKQEVVVLWVASLIGLVLWVFAWPMMFAFKFLGGVNK